MIINILLHLVDVICQRFEFMYNKAYVLLYLLEYKFIRKGFFEKNQNRLF